MLQQHAAISSKLQFPKTLFQGTLTSVACVLCISFSSGFADVSCRNECVIRVLWTFSNSMQLITPSVLLKIMLWLLSLWPLHVYCEYVCVQYKDWNQQSMTFLSSRNVSTFKRQQIRVVIDGMLDPDMSCPDFHCYIHYQVDMIMSCLFWPSRRRD